MAGKWKPSASERLTYVLPSSGLVYSEPAPDRILRPEWKHAPMNFEMYHADFSAEIKFQFLSFVGLNFYFLTVVSCVLEVVIIRRRDKKILENFWIFFTFLFISSILF